MLDLDFGKYGPYIVPAYAITVGVFAVMIWAVLAHARRWRRRAEAAAREAERG